jgi:hypothetical protein
VLSIKIGIVKSNNSGDEGKGEALYGITVISLFVGEG